MNDIDELMSNDQIVYSVYGERSLYLDKPGL